MKMPQRPHLKNYLESTRLILFSLLQIAFVGGCSAYYFILNQPQSLAKFGAVAIVWSLYNISRRRPQYSEAMQLWEKELLSRQLRYQDQINALRDEALTNTFDLHASQIAQISQIRNRPNPFVANSTEAIRSFCIDVQQRISNETEFTEKQQRYKREFVDFQQEYSRETGTIKRWENLFWKLELFLIGWGTLQSAYGANLVSWYHQ